eukprot:m.188779 g.188779  ORF g.188779 m.188779 type:complete len:876 (+) comp17540_c0_seq1:208-2835(+)
MATPSVPSAETRAWTKNMLYQRRLQVCRMIDNKMQSQSSSSGDRPASSNSTLATVGSPPSAAPPRADPRHRPRLSATETREKMQAAFAKAKSLWTNVRAKWNLLQRAERRDSSTREAVGKDLPLILLELLRAENCARQLQDHHFALQCLVARSIVALQQGRLLGSRLIDTASSVPKSIMTLSMSELQHATRCGSLHMCNDCLRPIQSDLKVPVCQFCKVVSTVVANMVDAARDVQPVSPALKHQIEAVLWGTRHLKFVSDILDDAKGQEMVDRVLTSARSITRRHSECCTGTSLLDQVLCFGHVEAATFLKRMAMAYFRKTIVAGTVLSSTDSRLFDGAISFQARRPVCALCRVKTSLKESHIISKGLMKASGDHGPRMQPLLAGRYGQPEIVEVTKQTVRLCCGACEAIFSKNGETSFCEPFRKFIEEIDRVNPKLETFQVDLLNGVSPIFHAIVGIAFRSFALIMGLRINNKTGGDLAALRESSAGLMCALRATMLSSNDTATFRMNADSLVVRFAATEKVYNTSALDRPLFVVDRSIGSGLNVALVHICVHALHFYVFRKGDAKRFLESPLIGYPDVWQTVDVNTTCLVVDPNRIMAPVPWTLEHDVELFDDAVRCFAKSMRRDLVEKHLGPNHPALECIPRPTASIRDLEGPLVRLPKNFEFRVPQYEPNPHFHHSCSIEIAGNGHVCHVHRTYFRDQVDTVNVHLCCNHAGKLIVVLDVDMTKLLGQFENVSHLRPRLVFAVFVQNPKRINGRVEWDITPCGPDDHRDLFQWDNGAFAELGRQLPIDAVRCMFEFPIFRARLHEQVFKSVGRPLRPLPPAVRDAFFDEDGVPFYNKIKQTHLDNITILGQTALQFEIWLLKNGPRCSSST